MNVEGATAIAELIGRALRGDRAREDRAGRGAQAQARIEADEEDRPDDAAEEQRHAGIFDAVELAEADQGVDHPGNADECKARGCEHALVERAHD